MIWNALADKLEQHESKRDRATRLVAAVDDVEVPIYKLRDMLGSHEAITELLATTERLKGAFLVRQHEETRIIAALEADLDAETDAQPDGCPS